MAISSIRSPAIEEFQICGATPFWSAPDSADIHREQAYALLTIIAGAFHASEGLNVDDHRLPEPVTSFRPRIIAHALEGIAALVALSQHATDCAQSNRGNGGAVQ